MLGLLHTLQSLAAARLSPSITGNRNLFGDLLGLGTAVYSDCFDIGRIKPLMKAVLDNDPDDSIWYKVYDAAVYSVHPVIDDSWLILFENLQTVWILGLELHIKLLLPAEVFIKYKLSNGSVSFGPGFFLAPALRGAFSSLREFTCKSPIS